MDIEELKYLASSGESETLEFKKSTAKLKTAVQTLCGFLNDGGGNILLGGQCRDVSVKRNPFPGG